MKNLRHTSVKQNSISQYTNKLGSNDKEKESGRKLSQKTGTGYKFVQTRPSSSLFKESLRKESTLLQKKDT